MLKSMQIEGYRGISKLSIEGFSDINLFVGYNRSGKSTILESIYYLINPGNAGLPINTNVFRNMNIFGQDYWPTYFNQYMETFTIAIDGLLDNGEQRGVIIQPRLQETEGSITESASGDTSASGMSSINEIVFDPLLMKTNGLRTKAFKVISNKTREYDTEVFIDQEGKTPKIVNIPDDKMNLGGIYLTSRNEKGDDATRFHDIQVHKKNSIKKIVKFLKIIEPSLQSLVLGSHGNIFADIGGKSMVPVQLLGDGFSRALSIALAIETFSSGIVIIDEIENGISYSVLEEFWKYIFVHSKANNVQIFAATHSIETIQAMYVSAVQTRQRDSRISVIRVERDNQEYLVTAYSKSELGKSLDMGWEIR